MSPTAQILSDAHTLLGPVTTVSDLYHSFLVLPGTAHLEDGRNCQDYALTRHCSEGTVIVVADGASRYRDEMGHRAPSFNEAGAIILAEVALKAAIEGLEARLPPDAIHELVALQIHAALRGLWAVLGECSGLRTLCSTLLLGIITPTYARIHVSGDGAWGVFLPAGTSTDSLVGDRLVVSERPGLVCVRGSVHTPELGRLAATAARRSASAVREALPVALGIDAPIVSAWVASDGLQDEPALQAFVHRYPARSKDAIRGCLRRPAHCDDLALAWASTRFASDDEEVCDAS